jgi:hypothetical protein
MAIKKKTGKPTEAKQATEVIEAAKTSPNIVEGHLAGRRHELDELVTHINFASQKTLDGLEVIGKSCARAADLLPSAEDSPLIDEFVRRLDFEPSKFSKFVQIGRHEFMWSPEVKPHLPRASFTSLYVVCRLGGVWRTDIVGRIDNIQATIREAIADGVLNPRATREELSSFVVRRRKQKTTSKEKNFIPVASISAPLDMDDDDYEKLEADLRGLRQRYAAQVILNREKLVRQVKDCHRKQADYMADKVNIAIQVELSKIGKTPERARRESQLKVSASTPLTTMSANLAAVGLTTMFDMIRDDAEKRYPLPPTILAWTTGRWKDHPALRVEATPRVDR